MRDLYTVVLSCEWMDFHSCDWCSFGSGSLHGPLPHGPSAVVFLITRLGFWDFNSTVSVDVVRVKSCLLSLSSCVCRNGEHDQ